MILSGFAPIPILHMNNINRAICLPFSARNRPFSSFSFVPSKRVKHHFDFYMQIIAKKCLEATETEDRRRYPCVP